MGRSGERKEREGNKGKGGAGKGAPLVLAYTPGMKSWIKQPPPPSSCKKVTYLLNFKSLPNTPACSTKSEHEQNDRQNVAKRRIRMHLKGSVSLDRH